MEGTIPAVYIVSDSIGETAEMVVKAVASQFDSGRVEIVRVPNVAHIETIDEVIKQASSRRAIIAYTLVVPELAVHMAEQIENSGVVAIDLIGPGIRAVENVTGLKSKGEPGLLRKIDEMYFKRVEAIEFAVRYDDGKDPRGIELADIVLIGVSRSSKTPLSMYLAHKRIKVANIPLVPEVGFPEELFSYRYKVIGLTINPEQLMHIRRERLRTLGLNSDASYANDERILEELDAAHMLMKKLGCSVIDVTNKAVEETASKIMEIYYRRISNVR
ncbi:MAG: pyruvate, water dikinase regulatory protein [Methylocystaceae bacterium]